MSSNSKYTCWILLRCVSVYSFAVSLNFLFIFLFFYGFLTLFSNPVSQTSHEFQFKTHMEDFIML